MVAVARQANVARPGEIDFPAWTVGRIWCRAGVPDCPHCPLKGVCPRLIDRGAGVKAV
jgi:endonuclease III